MSVSNVESHTKFASKERVDGEKNMDNQVTFNDTLISVGMCITRKLHIWYVLN